MSSKNISNNNIVKLDKYVYCPKYLIYISIISLSLGGLGGSFQLSRIILLVGILYIFSFFHYAKFKVPKNSSYAIGLFVFLLWEVYGFISLLWSSDPITGLKSELIVIAIGFSFVILSNDISEIKETYINRIRISWVIGFVITAIIAIWELSTMQHVIGLSDEERILGGIGNVPFASVFFGNINNYCTYITICFPYILWTIAIAKSFIKKVFTFLLLLSAIIIVLINGSRTGLFILILQISIFFLLGAITEKKIKTLKYLVIISIIILLLVLFLNTKMAIVIKYRLSGSFGNDDSAKQRIAMILCGLQMLIKSIGFGTGAGSFLTSVPLQEAFIGPIVNPHNLFIEIVSQYGITIFALYFFWIVKMFIRSLTNIRINRWQSIANVAFLISIPLIGMLNSHALGYTYWWVAYGCSTIMSDYHF